VTSTSFQRIAPGERMRRNVFLVGGLAAVLLGGVVINQVFGSGSRREPLQQLTRMRPERPFAPRLSIPTTFHACTTLPADGTGTVPREKCGISDEGSLPLRALADAWESSDPDTLQASALAATIWPDKKNEAALDRAILSLEAALRLSSSRVPLLVDLSAVHLVRAEREQNPRDLAEALQAAEEAVALDPQNLAARYNSALAMQTIGLDERADSAWAAYLALDSTSAWADDARQRRDSLITTAVAPTKPVPGATEEDVAQFALQYPQEAREFGWDSVLGEWGAAVEEGSTARAAPLLDLADGLGLGLKRRNGGDASLADAVRAIRQEQSDPAATLILARAHRAYAEGRTHYPAKPDSALRAFDRVISANPPSSELQHYAKTFRAGSLVYLREFDKARAELRVLAGEVDSNRYPAEAGRIRWMLGSLLLRDSKNSEAITQYQTAAALFSRAGEAEFMAAMLGMAAEAMYEAGDTLAAYRTTHRAQRALRSYRTSVWLHTHLHGFARYTALDGMSHAALAILDEDVRVTEHVATEIDMLDALQARSRARTIIGDSVGAARDLDSVYALVPQLPAGERQQRWAHAVIQLARADEVSAAELDAAVASFSDNVLWLVPALLRRADAQLAKRNLVGAAQDLERVTTGVRALSLGLDDALLRGALLEQARSRFDRLAMLNLRMGMPVDALRALERGRLSFARQRDGKSLAAEIRLSAPPGHVALDYALIGDTLVTWTIRGDTIRVQGQPVDRDTFMLIVEQVNAALESSARDAEAIPGLRLLYDWLIRPVRGYLGPSGTPLIIVADGEVGRVPFAALLDSARNEYLVRDYPVRYAPTLADAARPASVHHGSAGPALLVANPAFDEAQYPRLYPLKNAGKEVDSLLGLYPDRVVLKDSVATRDAFLASARSASLIHYAGHAVFDDARPERSHLVLAGADTTGRLTAEAVSTMRLGGVRLVVLSACRTLPSREGRSGGFAGLSGALLTAGAGGVVGSLWQVSDQLTRPLMQAFHEEYRKADPANALRNAQLRMLDSDDPKLSSPAAWAGFRYTGAERP
jgi:CHAT domain-containing protein